MINNEVTRHIKTHTERSSEDQAAVHFLENHLKSDGRINLDFAAVDKWPNTDGRFEFVSNPDISRRPEQDFVVQIKGTHYYEERDGKMVYQLKSLAFPAFIYQNVSLDPGILFLVTDPDERGEERVFWKYMSAEYVHSIDYSKDSCTVKFDLEDEIKYTDESIDQFCKKLEEIAEHHSFAAHLDQRGYSQKEIQNIMEECSNRISECIDRSETYNETRDDLSKNMLRILKELCVAALLMNALSSRGEEVSVQLAWESALLDIETKYLANFYKGLDYIGYRTPEIGQSERLMLKYYDFMWKIREMAKQKFGMEILGNLEKFPLCINELDQEYYEMIAEAIESAEIIHPLVNVTRFYVHKKTAFYVGKERYFELTLQLASIYATKFNRITVYTKLDISTNYSVQIAYSETTIKLWGVESKIKVVTDWKVSIEPSCLNKMGKILKRSLRISSKYGEYDALMRFLTITGINLLDLIDLKEINFNKVITEIYKDANTKHFKEILQELRENYSADSTVKGRNVVRYLLFHLREELIESVAVNRYSKCLSDNLGISSGCYPFESNPYISNLNNMNNYFQCANNKGEPVVWDEWTYKKGDPVLFNDSKRFPILYNNLKGWIAEIEKTKKEIQFTIDIDLMLTEKECKENGIEYIGENGKYTRIRFSVFKYDNNVPDDKEDKIDEMRMKAVVPFQLAYAVSIHKAQGLEYDSVKIVIPDSNSERVTHGVFYTAITRAKKKLKIYWSAETMQSIVDEFSNDEMGNRSLEIIKKKLS